jgi:hypothetical protein
VSHPAISEWLSLTPTLHTAFSPARVKSLLAFWIALCSEPLAPWESQKIAALGDQITWSSIDDAVYSLHV